MSLKERLAGLAKKLRGGGKEAVVKAAAPTAPAAGGGKGAVVKTAAAPAPAVGGGKGTVVKTAAAPAADGGKMPEGTAKVAEKTGSFPGKAEAPRMSEAAGRSPKSARAAVKTSGEMPRGSGERQMAGGTFPAAAVPKNGGKGEFPGSSVRMPKEGQAARWETAGRLEFAGVVGLAGPGEDPARGLSELLRVRRRMGPTAATFGEEVL